MIVRTLLNLAEKRKLPDSIIRLGIRALLAKRLRDEAVNGEGEGVSAFVRELQMSPVAINTDAANTQHYEVPTEYFTSVLGPQRKYSSCLYPTGRETLAQAEEEMLQLTAARAEIHDGMEILELGCGWGSFTLYAARVVPNSKVVGVSNSSTQRQYILDEAARRGLSNVEVITADMNDLALDRRFDRIVSIEMFEHMRNYRELLRRIRGWLHEDGKLFVHIFTHRRFAYPFETEGDDNWMGRYFFTGGIMPSESLLLHFQEDLLIERLWRVNGKHYQKTLEEWLKFQDENEPAIRELFKKTYGDSELWIQRWRIFYLACSELFGYRGGEEWYVSHYLFKPRQAH